jgi:membrane peptidoglycan carboxypeptidase
VQNPWRRAGFASGAAGRIAIVSVVAGALVAAIVIPVTGVVGVAVRDAAKTFNTLSVPPLQEVPTRSQILDSEGHLIAYYYPGGIYRVPVTYDQISPYMRTAIVAIEDSRYYEHGALDPRGTLRAISTDLHNTQVQGGSTLAQQYVKNALILTAHTAKEKADAAALTAQRKIRELRMAASVEHDLTKNELLAAYLNVAYFDHQAYGIQVAAEFYFRTSAANLTLDQSALLAGLVEDPAAYDPMTFPQSAVQRRNTVLLRMFQLHKITRAAMEAADQQPLGLHTSSIPEQTGCFSASAQPEAFFCDYVLAVLRTDPIYAKVQQDLDTTGGLTIRTTLNAPDERAARFAVNYVQPPFSSTFNPGHNADVEALIQPGTGRIRAIAENRPYGTGPGQTTVDYAVERQYDGGAGVQTGSSSKLFTLLTALKQNTPFGFNEKVSSPAALSPYYDCHGQPTHSVFNVVNDEPGKGIFTLYNGTTQSINVFYAELEQKVGLCNVVKTAVSLGVRRADGLSLLTYDKSLGPNGYPADELPTFTLGAVNVTPMSMAAAYATVASNGIYCKPVAIQSIVTSTGTHLPVESAGCHRVLSPEVAEAANTILQGVLVSPGTAAGLGINRPAAAKTGTANGGAFAAFGGYTPTLAGYVSVYNPNNQFGYGAMVYPRACYRQLGGGLSCPGQMFGANAPGSTWEITFLHAQLGPAVSFPALPFSSLFYAQGSGVNSPKPPKPTPAPSKPGRGGGGPGRHVRPTPRA